MQISRHSNFKKAETSLLSRKMIKFQASVVTVLGGLFGRFDHVLSSLHSLLRFQMMCEGCQAILIDGVNLLTVLDEVGALLSRTSTLQWIWCLLVDSLLRHKWLLQLNLTIPFKTPPPRPLGAEFVFWPNLLVHSPQDNSYSQCSVPIASCVLPFTSTHNLPSPPLTLLRNNFVRNFDSESFKWPRKFQI